MRKEDSMQYYEVKLGGQIMRVAHERGAEYIEAVAAYVEQKLQARAQATHMLPTMRLALMAALEIADELFAREIQLGQNAPRRESLQ
jgi:cell division protein ZapA (FtsZ GTPase activity inhibitor)